MTTVFGFILCNISNNVQIDSDTVQGMDLVSYVKTNEHTWNTDNTGGTSDGRISQLLVCNYDFYFQYDCFSEWLYENYVPRTEFEEYKAVTQQKIDHLMAYALLNNEHTYTEIRDMELEIKANRERFE